MNNPVTPSQASRDDRDSLALVAEALDQPAAERDAWVAARTDGQPALRHKVLALLAADAALEADELEPELTAFGRASSASLPPRQIGPWQLEELIGAGGMGSVYRAERNDGLFQQTVAIKFIRELRSSRQAQPAEADLPIQALIDAERRTLARMEHPRIARILDAGVTDNGLQFLVMEFVHGEAVDQHVESRALPLRERVSLMRSVCAAVAHAHQNLVLHCDLKPANILVAQDGRPKLIDFGVARLQDLTMAALPAGMTRAYSSPERLAGLPATPSDDVFALGIVMRDLFGLPAADGRAAEAGQAPLTRPVPHDLRAIVARAHAPARADRYPTVDALDDDLRRWLDSEPVVAANGGWRYRLGKLARRHPKSVAATAFAVVALMAALTLITGLYARAEAQRQHAEARFAELRSFSQYVLFDLDRQLEELPGTTHVRRGMVERGQQHLESLAASAGDNDEVLREAAVGTARLAELQGGLGMPNVGDSAASRENFERAERRLQALLRRSPDDGTLQRDLGRVQLRLADLYGLVGNDEAARLAKLQEAEAHLQAAVTQTARSTVRPDPAAEVELQVLLSLARIGQSTAQDYLGQSEQAARRAREESARLAALPAWQLADERLQDRLARAATQLGDSLFYLERFDESIEAYRRALQIYDRALAVRPTDRRLRQGATLAHWGASAVLLSQSRPTEAAAHSARSLSIAQDLAAADAEDRSVASLESAMVVHHARTLGAMGRRGEAIVLLRAELGEREERSRARPDDGLARRSAAVPLRLLANLLWEDGDQAGACGVGLQATAAWDALDRLSPLTDLDRRNEADHRKTDASRCGR